MFITSSASRKTLLSFVLLMSAHISARGAEVVLREQVRVQHGVVRLSDVAEIAGQDLEVAELKSVRLLPAPRTSEQATITRQQLRELLSLSGIDAANYSLVGAEQVTITGDVATHPAQIAAKIEMGDRVNLPSIQAATGTFPGEGTLGRKREIADVRRDVQTGLVALLGKLRPEVPRWNVAIQLPRHEEASLIAAELMEVRGGTAPYTGSQSFELVASTDAGVVTIPLDAMVHGVAEFNPAANPAPNKATNQTAKEARGPIVVKRGESVRVRAVASGVTVTTSAKALADGAINEVIEVEVDGHRSKVSARIVAPQLLEIYAASPQVATASK